MNETRTASVTDVDEIVNPVTRQRFVVRHRGEDTDGALFEAEMIMEPHGFVVDEHVHLRQQERFEVLAGEVGFLIDGRRSLGRPGDVMVVPPGTPHVWWNDADEQARVLVEVSPARRFAEQIETLYGLARDGRTDSRGRPGLLQAAVFLHEHRDELRPAGRSGRLLRPLLRPLALIGRRRGLRPSYPHHHRRAS